MKQIPTVLLGAGLILFAPVTASAKVTGSLQYLEPYNVEQLGPGMRVNPESKEYKEYKCQRSEQYAQSIVCRRSKRVGQASHVVTILHLYDNVVTYINKSVAPAFFTKPEVDSELDRLSRRFGNAPRIHSSTAGLIAIWGDIEFRSLSQSELMVLAQGGNPRVGFMVDFLSNPHDSARAGLPVYSLSGGKGYIWIASVGKAGRNGVLRFLAADPSRMDLQTENGRDELREPPTPQPPPVPPGPSPELSAARERLDGAGRAMTWIEEEYLPPEQKERYRRLKNEIAKASSGTDIKKINSVAASVENFIKVADTIIEKEKALEACKSLQEKLSLEPLDGVPPAIRQKRDDAVLRASTLSKSSTLSEIKSIRNALEEVQSTIADLKSLTTLRDAANRKILKIEEKIDLITDEEVQRQLQQRILDAKTALQSGNLTDAQKKVSDLIYYYDTHSEGNKFEPN